MVAADVPAVIGIAVAGADVVVEVEAAGLALS